MSLDWARTNSKDEQGSKAWHDWRNSGIGASDVPALLGLSPYKTIYTLWLEKTGQKEQFKGNPATERGKTLESVARKKYEDKCLSEFPASIHEYPEFPILRCSLDGKNEQLHRLIEIKCPGGTDHKIAKRGFVPEHYMPQCQAQLLITGYTELDYVSFDGEDIEVVRVTPDREMQRLIVEKAREFWKMVETKTPPVINSDEIQIEDVELEISLKEYEDIKEQIDQLTKKQKKMLESIEAIVGGRNIRCGEYSAKYIDRKGNIDYAEIPQLKSVDLEPFRKPGTRYIKIGRNKLSKD